MVKKWFGPAQMIILLFLVIGIGLLILGAELLVRGASTLAGMLRISPLVIGLTVVAFGTSAPELGVSVMAGISGQPDVSLGNVVGSNIFNVLLILGASATIVPLVVAQRVVRFDVPLMIGVTVVAWLLALNGRIDRWEGLVLVAGLLAFTIWNVLASRWETPEVVAEYTQALDTQPPTGTRPRMRIPAHLMSIFFVLAGLGALMLGSHCLVTGAVGLARWMGISELAIGLTIVAGGTSIPELFTSVVAALRGQRDIAVGNVVGSNVFNILGVLGLSAVVGPSGVAVSPTALAFDIPVMALATIACLPICFTGHVIARWEGGLLLAGYAIYTVHLFLRAGLGEVPT